MSVVKGLASLLWHVAGEGLVRLLGRLWGLVRPRSARYVARRVFNCNPELDLVIVYPPREEEPGSILPRVAGEDFMAIACVLKISEAAGFCRDKVRMTPVNRETGRIQDNPDDRNLVLICAPWSNPRTGRVLEQLWNSCGLNAKFHADPSSPAGSSDTGAAPGAKCKPKHFIAFYGDDYHSNTYEVEERARGEDKQPWKSDMKDYGLIVKAPNPYNDKAKVFIIAGIRGIGTWGAAHYLCHCLREIYDRFKDRDFAAVVEVDYGDFRIMDASVSPHNCRPLSSR